MNIKIRAMRSILLLGVFITICTTVLAQYTEAWTRHYNRNNQVDGVMTGDPFVDYNGNLHVSTLPTDIYRPNDRGYWSPQGMYTSRVTNPFEENRFSCLPSNTTPTVFQVYIENFLFATGYDLNSGNYLGQLFDPSILVIGDQFRLVAVDSSNNLYIRQTGFASSDHFWIVDTSWSIIADFAPDTLGYETVVSDNGVVYLWQTKRLGRVVGPGNEFYTQYSTAIKYYDINSQQYATLDTIDGAVSSISVNEEDELIVFTTRPIFDDYDSVELNIQVYSSTQVKLIDEFLGFDIYPFKVKKTGNDHWFVGMRYDFVIDTSHALWINGVNADVVTGRVDDQGLLISLNTIYTPTRTELVRAAELIGDDKAVISIGVSDSSDFLNSYFASNSNVIFDSIKLMVVDSGLNVIYEQVYIDPDHIMTIHDNVQVLSDDDGNAYWLYTNTYLSRNSAGNTRLDKGFIKYYCNGTCSSGNVSGQMFQDNDQSCAPNGQEPLLRGRMVKLEPQGYYAVTNNTYGIYNFNVMPGNYTIVQDSVKHWYDPCSSTGHPITVPNGGTAYMNLPSYLTPNVTDMSVSLISVYNGSVSARTNYLSIKNVGSNMTSGTVSLMLDSVLNFGTSSIAPNSVTGNQYVWNYANILPGEEVKLVFQTTAVAGTAQPANYFENQVTVNATGDADTTDNTAFDSGWVLDPSIFRAEWALNSVATWPMHPDHEYGLLKRPDSVITYQLNFGNTLSATADIVYIDCKIDDRLDIATLKPLVASHDFEWTLVDQKTVRFVFNNINLPAAGTSDFTGAIKFSIETKPTVQTGDSIFTNALVYFNYGVPLRTDSVLTIISDTTYYEPDDTNSVSSIDGATLYVKVYPNPVNDRLMVAFESNDNSSREVSLYSLSGTLVKQIKEVASSQLLIDVSDLAQGTYLIQVKQDGAVVKRERVVVLDN